ncbi:hypothetical protein [uncultured Nocardioides sp.]|uniref:hypothetical protein n=1 Tax=uncultured Nocardioides sp. TaxID=198441 RepID=UPI002631312D|nr:hypothetical protein [uncultured Nocardioides sp.]
MHLEDAEGFKVVEVFQAPLHDDDGMLWSTLSRWPGQTGELRPLGEVIKPGDEVTLVVHLRRSGDRDDASMSGLTINYADVDGDQQRTLVTDVALQVAARC